MMSPKRAAPIEFAVGNRHRAIVLLDKAIDLDPNRYVIRSNYALHLFNAMDAARAYEQQEHAYRLTEGSPDDARELCKFALFAGRICRAREVLQLLDRLKAGVPDDLRKTVLGASQIQAARGFDDDRAFSFLAKICGFVLERNLDSHTIVMGAVPDDEDGLITLDIIVNSSLDTVLQDARYENWIQTPGAQGLRVTADYELDVPFSRADAANALKLSAGLSGLVGGVG